MIRRTVNTESTRVYEKEGKYFLDFSWGIEVDPALIVNGVIPNNTFVKMDRWTKIEPVDSNDTAYEGLVIVLESDHEVYRVKTTGEHETEGIILARRPNIYNFRDTKKTFLLLLPVCKQFEVTTTARKTLVYEVTDDGGLVLVGEYERLFGDEYLQETHKSVMEELATMELGEFISMVEKRIEKDKR